MTVGSLFSGIGGFDLGFERAGYEIKWQVEIDDYASAVLAKHWPNVRRYRDVRTVGADLGRVDVICGGFPCQDVAKGGLKAGLDGARSGLWVEMERIIRTLRPRYVVVENVDGLLARGMGTVLGDLAEAGYDAEWACVSARDIGAPHQRDRIFLAAYSYTRNGATGLGDFEDGPRPLFAGDYPQRDAFWIQAPRAAVGVADGLPARLYKTRVEGLGNAIVPQIAEWIARRIMEYDINHGITVTEV